MSKDVTALNRKKIGRLFLPSLFLSRFSISPPNTLLSLLLIEIGLTFGLQVGVVGQISAATSFVSLIASFIMGALSIRFSHKLLLIIGQFIRVLSAVTCAFSTGYNSMLFFFSLNGLGTALITPMTMSLTAEHLQREKRGRAIGWIIMSMPLSSITGSLAINYIAGFSGWRLPFLVFILPINILGILLVAKGVPSSKLQRTHFEKKDVFKGFTEVLTTKSALACLAGTVFSAASIGGFLVYQASFFRQRYLMSMDFASLMFIGNALFMAMGSQIAGYFMKHVESRFLWALAMILDGASIIIAMNLQNVWISLILALVVNIQFGLAYTAANSLTLDQVPSFSGTIMSLFTAANSLGMTFGASVGGIILLYLNYNWFGWILGLFGFIATLIVYFWAHKTN